jgi:hypothetical protein
MKTINNSFLKFTQKMQKRQQLKIAEAKIISKVLGE